MAIIAALAVVTALVDGVMTAYLTTQARNAQLRSLAYEIQLELRDTASVIVSLADHLQQVQHGQTYIQIAMQKLEQRRATLALNFPLLLKQVDEHCRYQGIDCRALLGNGKAKKNHKKLDDRLSVLVTVDRSMLRDLPGIWRSVDAILLDQNIRQVSSILGQLQDLELRSQKKIILIDGVILFVLMSCFAIATWWLARPIWHSVRAAFDQLDNQREVLEHRAKFDSMTGLLNRESFMNKSREALAAPGVCALAIIDIDNFKSLNDQYGRPLGDTVLVTIAALLKQIEAVNVNVFRLSGDEFAILSTDEKAGSTLKKDCEVLLSKARAPIRYANSSVRITISIGIAVRRYMSSNLDQFIAHADMALYRCKTFSGNQINVAGQGELPRLFDDLAFSIQDAIEKKQIYPLYQPIVDLSDGSFYGFEALARWRHPVHGVLLPKRWIHQAAQGGLTRSLTTLIFESIFADWQAHVAESVPQIHVNIHPSLLYGDLLYQFFDQARVMAGRQWLSMEITEDAKLDLSVPKVIENVANLRRMGVRVALDDFGTGYGSLSHLVNLPIDEVKIDGEFVATVTENRASRAVVEAQVRCARDLGKTVIAERIETQAQWNLLRELGCNYGQGFYFGKPCSFEQARAVFLDQSPVLHYNQVNERIR